MPVQWGIQRTSARIKTRPSQSSNRALSSRVRRSCIHKGNHLANGLAQVPAEQTQLGKNRLTKTSTAPAVKTTANDDSLAHRCPVAEFRVGGIQAFSLKKVLLRCFPLSRPQLNRGSLDLPDKIDNHPHGAGFSLYFKRADSTSKFMP